MVGEVMRYLDVGTRVFQFAICERELQKEWRWCPCMDGWQSTNLQVLV